MNREAFKNLYLLFLLALLWGPSFLFIKIAVAEIAPVTLAALRIGIAAVLLNVFLAFSGGGWTRSFKLWKHLIIVGFLAQGLPFILINWGEQYIDSALASILNGLTPVFTIVLANFTMKDDKMTLEKVIGTGLGFVGLLILILPNITGQIQATTLGIVAVSIAAFCYGAAMVYARINLKGVPPINATASQLLATSLYLVPLSFILEGPLLIETLSWSAIGSVLALASFGTAIAFALFYQILDRTRPSYVSFVTYIVPVFAVILGITLLNESISNAAIIGAVFIMIGAMIINNAIKLKWLKFRLQLILNSVK